MKVSKLQESGGIQLLGTLLPDIGDTMDLEQVLFPSSDDEVYALFTYTW